MTIATLTSEIQSRVNALDPLSPPTPIYLATLSASTVGLSVDVSNAVTVLLDMMSNVSPSTSATDLAALDSSSINLGVTSKPIAPILSVKVRRGVEVVPGAGANTPKLRQINLSSPVDPDKTEITFLWQIGQHVNFDIINNGAQLQYKAVGGSQTSFGWQIAEHP